MAAFIDHVQEALRQFEPASAIDVLIIGAIIFLALLLMRGTTGVQLLRGIVILLLVAVGLVRFLDLKVLEWVMRNSFPAILIAIPIIFQPEIRRFLERVGRTGRFGWGLRPSYDSVLDVVIEAAQNLSRDRHGALLVLERETGLEEYVDTGIRLDATPSAELLEGLFYPNSPLHDGAVILRGNRVVAASCTLPLSGRLGRGHLGTRHRAALGITEHTDAVSICISEETGNISVAASGRMISRLDGARLGAILKGLFAAAEVSRVNGRGLRRLFR
jgi:diadenylate cyclase